MASTKQEESTKKNEIKEDTSKKELEFVEKHGMLYVLGTQGVTNMVNVFCAATEIAGFVLAVKGYKIPHLRK